MNAVPDPLRLFGPIPWRDVRSLAGPVVETNAQAGAQVIRAGDVVATFTLIRAGTVELRDGSTTVATLGPGGWFGEPDPAARRPQPYTVIARSPLRILTFSAFGIDRLCAAIPDAHRRIVESRPSADENTEPAPGPRPPRAPRQPVPPPLRWRSAAESRTVMVR
ncbi:MAG TPA: cyclic nucleotide-binding domain-containing protein [Solirubrobacteraceae bacterium]